MHDLETFISSLLTTQGWNAGQPFHLFPWERRFLAGCVRRVSSGKGTAR